MDFIHGVKSKFMSTLYFVCTYAHEYKHKHTYCTRTHTVFTLKLINIVTAELTAMKKFSLHVGS